MTITLENVEEILMEDNTIILNYIYSYKSIKFWKIEKEITVVLSNKKEITIPKGFTTDLCTVPRMFWNRFSPFGDFVLASILHDYLYVNRDHKMTRKEVDREMLLWSNILNKDKIDNYIRYIVVYLFGWTYWNKIITYKK